MSLQLTKHEVISLKKYPGFSEKWLQDTIANDASILAIAADMAAGFVGRLPAGRHDACR